MSDQRFTSEGERLAGAALQKGPKHLLAEMLSEAVAASPRRLQATFAALLIVLAKQASEDARRVVKLTWALFWLTLGLLVVAAIQVCVILAQTVRNMTLASELSHRSICA